MNKKLKWFYIIGIVITLLIVFLSVAYHFLIYLPKIDQKSDYDKCIKKVDDSSHEDWFNYCKSKGIAIEKDSLGNENCGLPIEIGEKLKQQWKDAQDRCSELYKSN